MTGWRAKRSQAAASSEVDVIRSMNDPMTLHDDSRLELPLAPQTLYTGTAWSKKCCCVKGLEADSGPRRSVGGSFRGVFRSSNTLPAIAPNRSVLTRAPRPTRCRRHREHDDAEREHRQSHEFEYQSVHGNVPLQYWSTC